MSYIVYQEKEDIAYAMVDKLISLSHSKQNRIDIAISGGGTPKIIFQCINKQNKIKSIQWDKLYFWWCDERCVNFDSEESNFGEADRILFQKIPIPRNNLEPIHGYINPEQAAIHYMDRLKNVPLTNEIPQFDWIWLGMGADGHTASIFPGKGGIPLSSKKLVDIASHPQTKQMRVTLTLKVINNAKSIDFLVTDQIKASMLRKIFDNQIKMDAYPAKAVRPTNGKLLWHIDQWAADELKNR